MASADWYEGKVGVLKRRGCPPGGVGSFRDPRCLRYEAPGKLEYTLGFRCFPRLRRADGEMAGRG